MKTLILFTLLFLSPFANAQYFAEHGATWHYSENYFFPQQYQEYFMKFEVTGDTIVNGRACSIIHKSSKPVCLGRADDEFVYASNDSVFFYDLTLSDFQMIYNFNANTGDSWDIILEGWDFATDLDTNTVIVDSTDFITINGQNLKRQYVTYRFKSEGVEYDNHSTIIERIGDTHYMFNYFMDVLQACDANWSGGLRCYEDTVLGLYETGLTDSCEYVESVGIDEHELSSFQLQPNPASDFIQIQMKNGTPDVIHIYDAHGRFLLRTENQLIDVSEFQAGMYFVKVLADGDWSQQRFVKN